MEPVACKLSASGLAERRDRWAALVRTERRETASGLRLTFDGGAAELAELVQLEQECCAFATWRLEETTVHVDGASPEAVAALHAMF